jgi:alpha-D-ribose 1-methylphosphonate 5-triphosphate synthase subunit PhnH
MQPPFAACSGACSKPPEDVALARVVAAWAELPEAIRAAVLLLVDSAAMRP